MEHYVGIDVSLELSSICVLDVAGKVIRETKVLSEPDALVTVLEKLNLPIKPLLAVREAMLREFAKLRRPFWGGQKMLKHWFGHAARGRRKNKTVTIGIVMLSAAITMATAKMVPALAHECGEAELRTRAYSPIFAGTLQVFTRNRWGLTPIGTIGGLSQPAELVVSGDGRKLYVNDWGTESLRVMDACTLQTLKLINVGSYSISSYISAGWGSDGRYIYVSSIDKPGISVVDTWVDRVVKFYSVPGIIDLHLSADGSRLYALTATNVVTLSPWTGEQIKPPLVLGSLGPTWATTSLDGSKLYLADTYGGGLTIVDAYKMEIIKTLSLPPNCAPIQIKIKPDGTEAWMVTADPQAGLVVLSTITERITHIIATNGLGLYVSFSPDGRQAYVAEGGASPSLTDNGLENLAVDATLTTASDIRVFDTTTYQQIGPLVPTGQNPGDLATVQPGVESGG